MNNLLRKIFMATLFLAALTGCGKDEEPKIPEGAGISEMSWAGTVSADEEGEVISLTFNADGKWSAESSEPSWCKVLTPTGVAGPSAMRIEVGVNVNPVSRRASIIVSVEGYPESLTIEISQSEGVTEKGDGR